MDCDLGDLDAGDVATITVTYKVAADEDPATIENSATATDADDNTATGQDSVDIVESVDLDVVKDFDGDDPETVDAGSTGNTFTITVTNNGPSNADDVQLTDTVDARLEVTGVLTDTGTCATPAQLVDCDLGDLDAGDVATITVTYKVAADEDPATIENSATATDADDNTATGQDSVDIVESVDLDVVKDFDGDDPETVDAGSTGNTFTITVTNNGPSNADDVQLTDTVDARLEVTGVLTDTGTCATPAQLVDCDLGDLDAAMWPRSPSPTRWPPTRTRPRSRTPRPRPMPMTTPPPVRTPSTSWSRSTSTS